MTLEEDTEILLQQKFFRFKKMKYLIFIQSRMNSKRFPGKALAKIKNKVLIKHVYDRLVSFGKEKIVVLTSINKTDDIIAKFCKKNKINFFRGSLNNVYKRFVDATIYYKCEAFIRITGDSILIDKKIIKMIISKFKTNKYDIVTNTLRKTFPIGLSVEMIKSNKFCQNKSKIKNKNHKEHIFTYFYENKNKFKIFNIISKKKYKIKKLAIDTKEDLTRIKSLINEKKN